MSAPVPAFEPVPIPEPRPPTRHLSAREWAAENLFGSVRSAVMTVVFGSLLLYLGYRALRFVLVTAQWEIVRRNLLLYMVGFFPRDEVWRLWAALFVLAGAAGFRAGVQAARAGRPGSLAGMAQRAWPLAMFALVLLWLVRSPLVAAGIAGVALTVAAARAAGARAGARARRWSNVALAAGLVIAYEIVAGLGGVPYSRWGGVLLTLFLAAGGIVLSFPVGVLLALGRRSTLPVVRIVCVGYVELIRGVPLVTLLFMGSLMLGFFLPPGTRQPELVTRALVALVMFTSAYVAEIVRGGLQSVPKGQTEAALALGLSPVRVIAFIVLPQGLRAVIPALVGQFISLFKDTSLVATIGLIELLGVAQAVTKQPDFLGRGLHAESLVFASFVFWVGAYWMSRASQRLERRLGVGER